MTNNTKWMLVVVALLVLLLVIFVPLAFFYGRYIAADNIVPGVTEPVQEGVGGLPSSTPVGATALPGTEIAVIGTNTPLPTNTLLPTNTPLPTSTSLPTLTPLPTSTPLPTNTPFPTFTPTPTTPCNWAQFVSDVTIPDGTMMAPGVKFTKIWRIKNIGTCTWTTEYSLNFVSGTAMTVNNTVVYLKSLVRPGEMIDVEVKLTSPTSPGTYTGSWLMKNPGGLTFGVGQNVNTPVHVTVQVLNVDSNLPFDFVLRMCEANWRNSDGDKLPCPTSPTGSNGFAVILANPYIEGRQENEPAIWVNPDHEPDGKIKATFPAYRVKAGDHLRTWIGCLNDNKGCNVTFEINYIQNGGSAVQLGSWQETYDGNSQILDIDLTFLADSDVNFILIVRINNDKYDKANAYWFVPRIVNLNP